MKKSRYSYTKEQLETIVASSRSIRQVLLGLGLNASGNAYSVVQKHIKKYNLDTSHFTGMGWLKGQPGPKYTQIPLNEIVELGLHPHYNAYKLKNRLLKSKHFEYRCYKCNLKTWNDLPIPLEIEHIDGNSTNHLLSNLTLLCPNCHAQTTTHAGKNRKKKVVPLSGIEPERLSATDFIMETC